MKAISFKLSGKTAFFKKPDVNVNTYFTYNNIHKVALLGLLGAVIGLGGYHQQYRRIQENSNLDTTYPEFYEKLKDLKVAIIPQGDRGYFVKKVQLFNNSVGYASKEAGGNLIVREQWLENPSWEILLLDDNSINREIFDKLEDFILNSKCVYMPYLGKNDHLAEITNCSVVELKEVQNVEHIDSLFPENIAEFGEDSYDEVSEIYFYREMVPVSLNKEHNFYEFKSLCFTNLEIEDVNDSKDIYQLGQQIIAFI
ncbi:MAG: CRISPR-associated protein Cas5h [Clostridiales bacterium]|nr:CRISPR-associated protein Cas5h [Clostridiales bacterium]